MKTRALGRKTVVVTMATAVGLTLTGGVIAAAATRTTNPLYRACAPKKGGTVRMLTAKQHCRRTEVYLNWRAQGPRGYTGPRGFTGPQGPKGDTGPQGIQGPQGAPGDSRPNMILTNTNVLSGNLTSSFRTVAKLTGLPGTSYDVSGTITAATAQNDHSVLCGLTTTDISAQNTNDPSAVLFPQVAYIHHGAVTNAGEIGVLGPVAGPNIYVACLDEQASSTSQFVSVQDVTLTATEVGTVSAQ
jgi:hypothetical protein